MPKEYIKLSDLPVRNYAVKKFKLSETKYGIRIQAELDQKMVFLPTREQQIYESMVTELNKRIIILCYQGKNSSGCYIVNLIDTDIVNLIDVDGAVNTNDGYDIDD